MIQAGKEGVKSQPDHGRSLMLPGVSESPMPNSPYLTGGNKPLPNSGLKYLNSPAPKLRVPRPRKLRVPRVKGRGVRIPRGGLGPYSK